MARTHRRGRSVPVALVLAAPALVATLVASLVTVLAVALTVTVPTAPAAAEPAAQSEPQPAVQRLGETVLDPAARGNVTYAATANVASYQQDALLTHGDQQFAAWYAGDRQVVVARRTLPAGRWRSLRLDAALWADDSHNTITLGVSPSDGRLHVALATHGAHVRYVRSLPGLVSGALPWRSTSFEPLLGHLPGAVGKPRGWTYPTFELHRGDLLLTWRDGTASRGEQALARYDAAHGWRHLGAFTGPGGAWSSPHGTSTSRYSYLHGFTSNPVTGDLEISWTWRENASAQDPRCRATPANRDLGYARSDDGGLTWRNDAGQVIGRTGTADVITTDDPHVVVPVDVTAGMINQESQAVDSAGRLHVLTSQLDDEALAAVGGCLSGDYYAQRAAHAHPVHHWRDTDGWHSTTLPVPLGTGGRSQLVFGVDDTAYVVLPDGRLAAASAADDWQTWRIVFTAADVDSISEQSLDRRRLAHDGVLSVLRQGTGVPRHAHSPLVVADFALSGDGPAPGSDTGQVRAPAPMPYAGSAPLGVQLTATSAHPNLPAHFAVDGDPGTAWATGSPVVSIVEGAEWVLPGDAAEAVDGGATVGRPQVLDLAWPTPRWIGSVTLDPGGRRGPAVWRIEGRAGAGEWVTLREVTQPTAPRSYPLPRTRLDAVRLVVTAGHDPRTVRVAELALTDRTPDNLVSLTGVTREPRRARARLHATVPEAGVLQVLRTPGVKPHRLTPASGGRTTLVVTPRGAAAKQLSLRACRATRSRTVAVRVEVAVRFTPTGGAQRTVVRGVRLVRRCG